MRELPTGTVTFLFTDIEGSTRLVQALGTERFSEELEVHQRLLREAIARSGGVEIRTEGDSFFVVFTSATDAVEATIAAQRALLGFPWPEGAEVRVRMGLHTGEGVLGGDNYVGLDVHRAARVAAAGHGGQILLSSVTESLVRGQLPSGTHTRELGTHRLKDLAQPEQLYQLVIESLSDVFPPVKTLEVSPHNLPQQLTSFVGRRQVEEVVEMLTTTRLLTLTGPGGTGKTRLGLQVAAEVLGEYPDGVFFVDLSPITDPALVAAEVASTLGLQQTAVDPDARVRDYLETKRMLLVLDNFEQVLEAAPVLGGWLKTAPSLKVLVTSRAPLRLYGEREYQVPALDLPLPDQLLGAASLSNNEAVTLFLERAMAAAPEFRLTDENAAEVVEIVTRLDGLPLAIELAASRVRVLSPKALVERLTSRLGLLVGGSRDLPSRQQTLRGAIDWSYDLLPERDRRLFARLSVFSGGAALPGVEQVCGPPGELGGEILDALDSLLDHSLIRRVPEGSDLRYMMLETIREYSSEKLTEFSDREEMRRRHATYYGELALEAKSHLVRQEAKEWLDRLDAEIDNLRTAMNWALEEREGEIAQRLAGSLWRFWQMRGHIAEGRARAVDAISMTGTTPKTRIDALEAAGGLAYWQADWEGATRFYEEALKLSRELGDEPSIATALYNSAVASWVRLQGDEEVARQAGAVMAESLAIGRRIGEHDIICNALWQLGTLRLITGDPEASLPLYDEALHEATIAGNQYMVGWTHRMRGEARFDLGDLVGARADFLAGLEVFVHAGDMSALALHIRDFAALAMATGDDERALRLAGAQAAMETVSETGLLSFVYNQLEGIDELIMRVGQERAEELIAEGRTMSPSEAVAYAQEPVPAVDE